MINHIGMNRIEMNRIEMNRREEKRREEKDKKDNRNRNIAVMLCYQWLNKQSTTIRYDTI